MNFKINYFSTFCRCIFLTSVIFFSCNADKNIVNLVPDAPGKTPSYWCTWGAQNSVDSSSLSGASLFGSHSTFAANLNEESVFNNRGWVDYYPKVKGDLYLLFDLGWDVPAGVIFDKERWRLGSSVLPDNKFPCCDGTPGEKLKKLNDKVKGAGWRGAGLWIAAQPENDFKDGKKITGSEVESFFRERARWSHYAGIQYWKVDYGARGDDKDFRYMLTRIAKQEAPGLILEHARNSGPVNDEECPWDYPVYHRTGRFKNWGDGKALENSAELISFSDVFRTYDVTPHLSIPTTFDRISEMLLFFSGKVQFKCLLNAEDEVYMGAALGCAFGVMRHPQQKGTYDPNDYNKVSKKLDEVTRAARWQRIAPAFGVGQSLFKVSGQVLTDNAVFKKNETWADWLIDKNVIQSAPAILARGIALPVVISSDSLPYVAACLHPNGATAVITLPRVINGNIIYPLADVSIDIGRGKNAVGIFGQYKSLKLILSGDIKGAEIWAQDLAANKAVNITDQVTSTAGGIILSGSLINKIGLSSATKDDKSDPGMVVMIK